MYVVSFVTITQAKRAARQQAVRIPPLNRPAVRKAVISGIRGARWSRARFAERLGVDRYSAQASCGMDRCIADLLGRGGFFVEAGANDGFRQSNTYLLERFYGWRGLLVEPMPSLFEVCRRRREVRVENCALGREAGKIEMTYADLNSGVRERETVNWGWEEPYRLEVPVRTLTELLEDMDAPRPDLLSLDVEGYEPEALAGLDLDRYGPTYILIEAWQGLEPLGLDDHYRPVRWFSDKDALLERI
jgi:FkbM family methyltransferase